jgi:hypothetical protein
MSTKAPYRELLKQDLGSLIDALEITELQKHFLHSRWLDQVLWMEGKADHAQKRYYLFRLTAIVGGVTVPALVSLNLGSTGVMVYIRWATFVISLLVAVSVAVEEFFHYGERWRHYRSSVERLKIEGWEFFQLSGQYRDLKHAEAYPVFAEKVEDILRHEGDAYISEVVREKKKEKPDGQGE